MPLTRAEADQIAEEARQQGWEGDKRMVKLDGEEYNEGYGRIEIHDWDEINRYRIEHGNRAWCDKDGTPWTGCSVELKWPDLMGPEYWISDTDEWRKLKAKVDELKEIVKQALQRGWQSPPFGRPKKVGKFGMMIEVVPPGGKSYQPVRVGGMKTWRKLCREYDNIIDATPAEKRPAIEEGTR